MMEWNLKCLHRTQILLFRINFELDETIDKLVSNDDKILAIYRYNIVTNKIIRYILSISE